MEVTGFLIVKKGASTWKHPLPEWKAKQPGTLPANAISIKVKIEVPDSYFQKTRIDAAIRLPASHTGAVDVEAIIEDVEKFVKAKHGIEIKLV